MASRNYYNSQAALPGMVCVAGSFAPNGSSAVSAASNKGRGFSVARTSAGLFTLTFTDKFAALISAVATLQLATVDDKDAQVGTYTAASKTLTIRVMDASTVAETDVAANANNRINFICWFMNSSLASRGS